MEMQPQEKKKYPFSIRESFLCGGFFLVLGIFAICDAFNGVKTGVTETISECGGTMVALSDSPKTFCVNIVIKFIFGIGISLLALYSLILGFKQLSEDTKSSVRVQ